MGAIGVFRHAAIADLEHVGIVPAAGAGIAGLAVMFEADLRHGRIVVGDVAGGAPQMAADPPTPATDVEPAIFAQRIDDRPTRRAQGGAHLVIAAHHRIGIGVEPFARAEIIFQIIDAPGREGLRVLADMAVAALETGAGAGARRGIEAEFQAAGMNIGGQRLHVRELGVGAEPPVGTARPLPAVVDIDVAIAGVAQSGGDHRIGDRADGLVVDLLGELVPAAPAHRRRPCKAIGGKAAHRRQRHGGEAMRRDFRSAGGAPLLVQIGRPEPAFEQRAARGRQRRGPVAGRARLVVQVARVERDAASLHRQVLHRNRAVPVAGQAAVQAPVSGAAEGQQPYARIVGRIGEEQVELVRYLLGRLERRRGEPLDERCRRRQAQGGEKGRAHRTAPQKREGPAIARRPPGGNVVRFRS